MTPSDTITNFLAEIERRDRDKVGHEGCLSACHAGREIYMALLDATPKMAQALGMALKWIDDERALRNIAAILTDEANKREGF